MAESSFPDIPGYEVLSLIGSGGTSRVFLAENKDGQKVAIKVLHQHLASIPQIRKLLAREAKTLRKVDGPGVAKVLDYSATESLSFLIMEFVEGDTLENLVAKKPLKGLYLTNAIAGIADALGVIHEAGVTHRDLKPSNVILGPGGITVLDFGLSVIEEAASVTRPQELGGTPAWISPEQVNGSDVTPASHVFNLGMMIVYLASGENPFGQGKPEALLYRIANSEPNIQKLEPNLRRIAAQCLSKDPTQRPSLKSCRRMLAGETEPDAAAENRTVLASRTTIARAFDDFGDETVSPPTKSFRAWWLAVAGFAVAASLVVLDQFVFTYGGDVVFRYVNTSESNQPQSSSTVIVTVDGKENSFSLPSSGNPKQTSTKIGTWSLGSQVDAAFSPPFASDARTTLRATSEELGLSRFQTGKPLIIEVELTDRVTFLRVGFGSGTPLTNAVIESSNSRSNEAAILAQERAAETRYLNEQKELFAQCVSKLEQGWLDELGSVFALEKDYWGMRNRYFDDGWRDFDEWAPRAYGLSEEMFGQWLSAVSPARSQSNYVPYSDMLIDDAGSIFETHGLLSEWWSNLGDALLYFPPAGEGPLRDLFPRQYLFIDQLEDQLSTATSALRRTVSSDANVYCKIQHPDS